IYYMVEIDSLGTTTSVTDYINITDYSGPLFLQGDSVLVGPSSGVVYTWYLNGDPLTTASNTNEYQPEENGDYHRTIIMLNGCTITTGTVTVDLPIGIGNADGTNRIAVYPNPNSGTFDIAIEGGNASSLMYIELIDHNGKKVYGQKVNIGENKVWKHSINIQD